MSGGVSGGVEPLERGSRKSQVTLNSRRGRMRAPQHAPRRPFRVLERRYGFVEIV